MPKERLHLQIVLLSLTSLQITGSYGTYNVNEASSNFEESGTRGYFWQVSDIHWDQQYSSHGDPLKMCHDPHPTDANPSPKPYGDYSCDSPYQLVEAALSAMQEHHSQPDFVLWTGDITPHVKDPVPDWSVVFSSLRNVTDMLQERFPNTLLLPVLGNHDAFPSDVYPDVPGSFYHRYLDQGGWSRLLPLSAQTMFAQCGFYSLRPSVNLHVLILNTNLYGIADNTTVKDPDPCGQFAWLQSHLHNALVQNHRVVIAAHIPPGYFERWPKGAGFFHFQHQQRYVDLLNEYGLVIMAQVYGHTHTDTFRLMHDKKDVVKSVGFVAPSVTPWLHIGGVNPSIRLYSYAADSQEPLLLDYWQYFLNISALQKPSSRIEKREVGSPAWELLYQASDAYNVSDLSPSSIYGVYQNLVKDPELFQRYYAYNTVGHVFAPCNATCRMEHLCVMSSLNDAALQACLTGKRSLLKRFLELPYDEHDRVGTGHHVLTLGAAAVLMCVVMGMVVYMRTQKPVQGHLRFPFYKHTPKNRFYISTSSYGIQLADPVLA